MNADQTKRKGSICHGNAERVGKYLMRFKSLKIKEIMMQKMEIKKGRDEQWQNALLS